MDFLGKKVEARSSSRKDQGNVVAAINALKDEVLFTGGLDAIDLRDPPVDEVEELTRRGLAIIYGRKPTAISSLMTELAAMVDTTELDVGARWQEDKERAFSKLPSAYAGYRDVLTTLNAGRRSKDRMAPYMMSLQTEFKGWFTKEKLSQYEAVNRNPETGRVIEYDVIATPNVRVSKKKLYHIIETFGEGQPYPPYKYDAFFNFLDEYSDEELCGTDPDNGSAFIFSLVPKEYTPGLDLDAKAQVAALKELQADNPAARVPSVLEAVTRWHVLRAQGDGLADNRTADLTCIRHFDLRPKLSAISRTPDLPGSFVGDYGEAGVGCSDARSNEGWRIAVA